MTAFARVKYTGSTPGADSNTYNLFNSTTAFPGANSLQGMGVHKFVLNLSANQNGTLNAYKSNDRGTTWTQVSTSSVTGSATTATTAEYLVETYADFKLDFVNGGSAQTTWVPSMALADDRGAS